MLSWIRFAIDIATRSKSRRVLPLSVLAICVFVPMTSSAVPVQYTFSGTLSSNTGSDPLRLEGALLRSDVFADTSHLPVLVAGSETVSAVYEPSAATTSISQRPSAAADLAIASPGSLVTRNFSGIGAGLEWGGAVVSFPGSPAGVQLPLFVVDLLINLGPGVVAAPPLFTAADVAVIGAGGLVPSDFSTLFSYRLTNVTVASVVVPEPGTIGMFVIGLALVAHRTRLTSGFVGSVDKR
jgi:hypothetical protein